MGPDREITVQCARVCCSALPHTVDSSQPPHCCASPTTKQHVQTKCSCIAAPCGPVRATLPQQQQQQRTELVLDPGSSVPSGPASSHSAKQHLLYHVQAQHSWARRARARPAQAVLACSPAFAGGPPHAALPDTLQQCFPNQQLSRCISSQDVSQSSSLPSPSHAICDVAVPRYAQQRQPFRVCPFLQPTHATGAATAAATQPQTRGSARTRSSRCWRRCRPS